MNNPAFTPDVFLSHSSKDKAVVRAVAQRLRADGLKVCFDEWEIAKADGAKRKNASELQPLAFSLQPWLELSANAFGSDWAQLRLTHSQPSTNWRPAEQGAPLHSRGARRTHN